MKLNAYYLYIILIVVYLDLDLAFSKVPGSFDSFQQNVTRTRQIKSAQTSEFVRMDPSSWWYQLIYDDGYIRRVLDDRYPYLKRANGTHASFRDQFDFSQVFWPSEEYLAQVNFEQHIYEEHRAMDLYTAQTSLDIWSYSDPNELAKSGGSKRDDKKCQRDFKRLFEELKLAERDPNRLFTKGATNVELLRWIDSWGRPVSETYYGNSYWVGSYRGCKYAQVHFERHSNGTARSEPIKFNYCWAKLKPKDFPLKDEMKPKMSMRAGICVPESCDTIQVNKMRAKILQLLQFNFSPMHKQRFNEIIDVYCLPQKESIFSSISNMPKEARWFFVVTLSWLSIILASSIHYHFFHSGSAQTGSTWSKAFAIQENWNQFVRDDAPSPGSPVDLRSLGLIKLLACLMVVFAHCILQSHWNFHSSTIMLYESRRLHYHGIQFTWKTLEIFLVVTGIIIAYFTSTKFEPDRIGQLTRPRNFIILQVIRYARIAPVMMLACAFMKAIFVHLSEGPFWDYGTWKISPQGACQEISWWRTLIWPILLDVQGKGGSFYQHECIPSSWYVITELKMYLIIPFYMYMLVAWKRARIPLVLATLCATTFFKYLQLQAQQIAYFDQFFRYGEIRVHNLFLVSLESAYFTLTDRFHAMAIGLLAGLYLHRFKTGDIKSWPFWMRRIFPLVFVVWQVYDLTYRTLPNEIRFRETGEIPSDASLKSWLVFKPRFDAIMIALVSLLLTTDWAAFVMRYSLTIYKLSKLTYCVYMIHTLIIMFVTTAHEKARPDTVPLQLLLMCTFVTVSSFIIALPVYLLVESPFTLLTDHILAKQKSSAAAAAATLNHSSSSVSLNRLPVSDKPNNPEESAASGRKVKRHGANIKQKSS